MEFSPDIVDELKYYVYSYSDPDTNEVFYIGKGNGNRCFFHLFDHSESEKVRHINRLKSETKEPKIEILRYGLTDNEASLIEASLIDFVGLENLENKVRGMHGRSNGKISVNDLINSTVAEDTDISDKVMLITINKLYRSNMSREELYEATRGIWRVGERRNGVDYALSLFRGVVREVYEIEEWFPAGTLKYSNRHPSTLENKFGRWEFSGKIASDEIRNKYMGMSVKVFVKKGSQNPIKYVNC